MAGFSFPDGKRFAFTIMDDTDVATVENVEPVYRLLDRLGMRATKTVWPLACPEGSADFGESQTLEDPEYRRFVCDLRRRGFEIASHGATMASSMRERTVAGLERFHALFGAYPRVHANHAMNRENLYWGSHRFDDRTLRLAFRGGRGVPGGYYGGHVRGSPYWWGDLCAARITYVRNFTFNALDVSRINPSMPYHDPRRPLVPLWFSAADAESAVEFNELLRPDRIARLERDGGVCIVATHLGKGYVSGGRIDPTTQMRLEALARRPGWFPTVSELLDWLRKQRDVVTLPAAEWRAMQWRWARDLVARKCRHRWNGTTS